MVRLIVFGIVLGIVLIIWIIRMIHDKEYSSPFGDAGPVLAMAFSSVLVLVAGVIGSIVLYIKFDLTGIILGAITLALTIGLIVGAKKRNKIAIIGQIVFLAICIILCFVIIFCYVHSSETGLLLIWMGLIVILTLLLTGMISILKEISEK